SELVARVVGLGEVDGDEVRTVGGGEIEQRQRIVDARLVGLRRGLRFAIVGGVVRGQEAGDFGFTGNPQNARRAHALTLGKAPQRDAAVPGTVVCGLLVVHGVAS